MPGQCVKWFSNKSRMTHWFVHLSCLIIKTSKPVHSAVPSSVTVFHYLLFPLKCCSMPLLSCMCCSMPLSNRELITGALLHCSVWNASVIATVELFDEHNGSTPLPFKSPWNIWLTHRITNQCQRLEKVYLVSFKVSPNICHHPMCILNKHTNIWYW